MSAKMEPMHTSPHPRTSRHPVLLGLLEAFRIDLIVVPSFLVIATVFWIVGLGSQLPYSTIPHWALSLWSVVNGLSVSTMGFGFSLTPSLVTLGLWALLAAAASRIVAELAGSELLDSMERRRQWWTHIGVALGSLLIAYALPLLVLSTMFGDSEITGLGILRFLLLLLSAVVMGFVRARGPKDIPRLRHCDRPVWGVVAGLVRRLLFGALLLGLLVIVVAVVFRWSAISESMQVYSSPLAARIGLTILQILFAPGILFSALSWISGAGVRIGRDETSSLFNPAQGPVPDVPVLHLLVGSYPDWTLAAPALLVLLGVLAVVSKRHHAREVCEASWWGIGMSVAVLFVLFEITALFSGGAMGPLDLAEVGPPVLRSALAVSMWIGAGLSLGLLLTKLDSIKPAE